MGFPEFIMFMVCLSYLTIGCIMHRTVSILFIIMGVGKDKRSLICNHFVCVCEGSTSSSEKSQVNEFLLTQLCSTPAAVLLHLVTYWNYLGSCKHYWLLGPTTRPSDSIIRGVAWTCWGSDAAQVLLTYSQGLEPLPYSGACFPGFLVASWGHDWQLCHQRSLLSSDREKKPMAPLATWAPSPELLRAGNTWDIIGSEAPPWGSQWSGRIEESELVWPREELRQSFLWTWLPKQDGHPSGPLLLLPFLLISVFPRLHCLRWPGLNSSPARLSLVLQRRSWFQVLWFILQIVLTVSESTSSSRETLSSDMCLQR